MIVIPGAGKPVSGAVVLYPFSYQVTLVKLVPLPKSAVTESKGTGGANT